MIDHKQELFDKVSKHLLTQNQKSVAPRADSRYPPVCKYRGEDGRSCAVGCLIDDKYYNPECENTPIPCVFPEDIQHCGEQERVLMFSLEQSLGYKLTYNDAVLLSELQALHDINDCESWRTHLARIATEHDLTFCADGL